MFLSLPMSLSDFPLPFFLIVGKFQDNAIKCTYLVYLQIHINLHVLHYFLECICMTCVCDSHSHKDPPRRRASGRVRSPSWSCRSAPDAADTLAACCLCTASPACRRPVPLGRPAARPAARSESPLLPSTWGCPSPSLCSTTSPRGSCSNNVQHSRFPHWYLRVN